MTQSVPSSLAPGVLSWRLRDLPLVVVAVETTGFPAGRHRVCEIVLCRIEPPRAPRMPPQPPPVTELPSSGVRPPPRVVFDSLLDPGRPLTGGDMHGLSERDLEGAPAFEEVAAELCDHLSGAVIASYNAAFSLPFLQHELDRVGIAATLPHLSVMCLRPALGLGGRCALEVACEEAGVEREPVGSARAEAQATADLLLRYLAELESSGIETCAELAGLGELPFLPSLAAPPLAPARELDLEGRRAPLRRVLRSLRPAGDEQRLATRRYWEAVTAALGDFELSEVELGLVRRMRELLRLPEERVRAVHARAFLGALATFAGDEWLAEEEAEKLRSLFRSLSRLGWTPGE